MILITVTHVRLHSQFEMVSKVFKEDPVPIHALLSSLESATQKNGHGGPGENASVCRPAVSGKHPLMERHSPLKAGPSTCFSGASFSRMLREGH